MQKFLIGFLIGVFILNSNSLLSQSVLSKGWYRVTIDRADSVGLIFNVEIIEKNKKNLLYIRNGAERILVDDIQQKGDSVFIDLPFFESAFRLQIQKDHALKGQWIKGTSANNLIMPVKFVYQQQERFTVSSAAASNITGRWKVDFTRPNGTDRPAVAEFQQKGNFLTGTFMTPSGDYRYLEGVVSADRLQLSCFDGSHAYLFNATIKGNEIVEGYFYSSSSKPEKWRAVKNEQASLPDTVQRTSLKSGESTLHFSFRDVNGKQVSLQDPRYKNKVVVIQIMGSWCPNCMDESQFLSGFYKAYQSKGVEVLALAYEYSLDFNRSKTSIQKFIKRFQIKYPVLIAPATVSDELKTEKTLPQLTPIRFFPTTIFIDKKGNVNKIHSGFYGPGTGEHFTEFKSEFYRTIQALLAE